MTDELHLPDGPEGSTRADSGLHIPADPFHRRLHHIGPAQFSTDTAQTAGMRRVEAISGASVGARNLWMGQTHVAAATTSANHHHGHSETAIFILSGHPEFVFLDIDSDEPREVRIVTKPGDYVFVPPYVPHREENPDPADEAVVVSRAPRRRRSWSTCRNCAGPGRCAPPAKRPDFRSRGRTSRATM